eukprot:gene5829-9652_t
MSKKTNDEHQELKELSLFFQGLRSNDETVQRTSAQSLAQLVIHCSTQKFFSEIIDSLHSNFQDLIKESKNDDVKIIGLCYAMSFLIDIEYPDPKKLFNFSNYLRSILNLPLEPKIAELISNLVLGKLAKNSTETLKTIASEWIEFEYKRAMEWLQEKNSDEKRKYIALAILKAIAENSPTLFYSNVDEFFIKIWIGIKSTSLLIRNVSIQCLREALTLVSIRTSNSRVEWYYTLLKHVKEGLNSNKNEIIHGCLLVLAELLLLTGNFMTNFYNEVTQTVLKFTQKSDPLIRHAIVALIPIFGKYNPKEFLEKYFDDSMKFLLQSPINKGSTYLALGELTIEMSTVFFIENQNENRILIKKNDINDKILIFIKPIMQLVRDGITHEKYMKEPLICLSMLCKSLKNLMYEHVLSLMGFILINGISEDIISIFTEIIQNIPNLLKPIQERVIDSISHILARCSFHQLNSTILVSCNNNIEKVVFALKTLRDFNTDNINLIEFIKECVLKYLDHEFSEIRIQSSLTCSYFASKKQYQKIVIDVVESLLALGITDLNYQVRKTAISCLKIEFDECLSKSSNLKSLFQSLNDENSEIQIESIIVLGRLIKYIPSQVLIPLRKLLIQTLEKIKQSKINELDEKYFHILNALVCSQSLPRMIEPYSDQILQMLLSYIQQNFDEKITICSLEVIGCLCESIDIQRILKFKKELIFEFIKCIENENIKIMKYSILAMTKYIIYSGDVIDLYFEHPGILNTLLNIIKIESDDELRILSNRLIGFIGAIDPYSIKNFTNLNQNQLKIKSEKNLSGIIPEIEIELSDYFPTIAINGLTKILMNLSLSLYHRDTAQCIMYIFTNLNQRSTLFLKEILFPFFFFIRNTKDIVLRSQMIHNLCSIVSISKKKIQEFLDDIIEITVEFFEEHVEEFIKLIEEMAIALKETFSIHLTKLLPLLLEYLNDDQYSLNVLQCFIIFKENLNDYLDMIISPILNILELNGNNQIRLISCKFLYELCISLNIITDYSSRIIISCCRSLNERDLQSTIMEIFCFLLLKLKNDFVIFVPTINKILIKNQIFHQKYEEYCYKLLSNQELPIEFNHYNKLLREEEENDDDEVTNQVKKMFINEINLKKSWYAAQRSTQEDWNDWMKQFSIGLLSESPSPELRACATLAQIYQPLARELFNASFFAIWNELEEDMKQNLVNSLVLALIFPNLPQDILQILLNLVEFMEHQTDPLPLSVNVLGTLSFKAGAYAKALYHREREYMNNSTKFGELIPIYHALGQNESALGVMNYLQNKNSKEIQYSWYALLSKWNEASDWFEKKKLQKQLSSFERVSYINCLFNLEEWEKVLNLCDESFDYLSESEKLQVVPISLTASWNLKNWKNLKLIIDKFPEINTNFFKSIYFIHQNDFKSAKQHINKTRQFIDQDLIALVNEGYTRSYSKIFQSQMLSEMEEVINFKQEKQSKEKNQLIIKKWKKRLINTEFVPDNWSNLLNIHNLAISPLEDIKSHLHFARLCRKNNNIKLGKNILNRLINCIYEEEGMNQLNSLKNPYDLIKLISSKYPSLSFEYILNEMDENKLNYWINVLKYFTSIVDDTKLLSRGYLKLGSLYQNNEEEKLFYFEKATKFDENWYKAWHNYALINTNLLEKETKNKSKFLKNAIHSYFKSISLSKERNNTLQDTLRLLSVFFKYEDEENVDLYFNEDINIVNVDSWLQVIPQLIARVNSKNQKIQNIIHSILLNIGKTHPLALTYPLTVISKSFDKSRIESSKLLIDQMKLLHPKIIEQSSLVSDELIRIAILWSEIFHESLENAYKLFQKKNYEESIEILERITLLSENAETLDEISFQQKFGKFIQEAWEWCLKYRDSKNLMYLIQAWEIYYFISNQISHNLTQMKSLDLKFISPKLEKCNTLEINIPGTYQPEMDAIRILKFDQILEVIESKQKPRKLRILGSNGKKYQFLLKGHEDLRQDERVMQLFDLVNKLLFNVPDLKKKDLKITRYSILVLSSNVGLIGWVSNTNTLHGVIKKYRENRNINLNLEYIMRKNEAPDYDSLTILQKLEVFTYLQNNTSGQDLYKILWLQSRSSEIWLERRTNFTRSLAVMSIVGYLLGLGDRHPKNIMIEENNGKIVHVDFGDSFEVAMNRDQFPEKVPFRLTRMLINAMEINGINGIFKSTCESVMDVMRHNKDAVMAMLEAFVHDPLINWRLLETNQMSKENENKDDLTKKTSSVIERISNKLTGRDFGGNDDVPTQVSRLIEEATSPINLSQCFSGWCAFW